MKKLLKFFTVAMAAMMLLMTAACGGDGNGGSKKSGTYKTPFEDIMKMVNANDTDLAKYQNYLLDPIMNDYLNALLDVMKGSNEFKDALEENEKKLDQFAKEFTEGIEISDLEFSGAEEASEADLKSF